MPRKQSVSGGGAPKSRTQGSCVECQVPLPPRIGRGRVSITCGMACRNKRRLRMLDEQRIAWPNCSFDDCELTARSAAAEYCEKHYGRQRRKAPMADPPRRGEQSCVVGDCDLVEYNLTTHLCRNHHLKYRACGNPIAPHGNWREVVNYYSWHGKLARLRGKASEKTCPCGRSAAQWSYDHLDPDELVNDEGLPYSLNPDRYVARCVPCHVRFDLDRK